MNIDQFIFNKKVQIAFAECLILLIPLAFWIYLDFIYSSDFFRVWVIGLVIFVFCLFFYLIFGKKYGFELEVFFYSIGFTSSICILWVLMGNSSTIEGQVIPDIIPDFILTIFYTLDLPSLFSFSLPNVYALYAIPSITLFYLFAIFSKNDKTNRDKLLILLLTFFVIISLALCLLLDLKTLVSVFLLCLSILPIIAGLYAGYYLIYRKLLPSLHLLSWIPTFAYLLMFLAVIILEFTWYFWFNHSVGYSPVSAIGNFVVSFLFAYIIGRFIKNVHNCKTIKKTN